MLTLQTMMQTVCQLVNRQLMSDRTSNDNVNSLSEHVITNENSHVNHVYVLVNSRLSLLSNGQQQTGSNSYPYSGETMHVADEHTTRANRMTKQAFVPKAMANAMDELLTFAQRMNIGKIECQRHIDCMTNVDVMLPCNVLSTNCRISIVDEDRRYLHMSMLIMMSSSV
jgi:hypothetical protein